jgi:hypothetical protein
MPRPTYRYTNAAEKSIPGVASIATAHARLAEHIRTNLPHHIPNWHVADYVDFDDRAEHLRQLLVEVEVYVRAAMQDIKDHANIRVDVKVADGILSDTRGDIVGELLNCADDLRNGMGRAA